MSTRGPNESENNRVHASGNNQIRLIATDLDHTLLDEDGHVSARTRAALDIARAADIHVVPVTARQPLGLRSLSKETGFASWALCSNGAYAVHLSTHEVLFAEESPAAPVQRLAEALNELIPDLLYGSVRKGGEQLIVQHGYADVAHFDDHKRDPAALVGVPLRAVLSEPTLKLVIRHATLSPHDIFDAINQVGYDGLAMTLSGAPFVELMAEGVSKASGLEQLCARLGIDRGEVIAFGDGLNDIEMLQWAGRGVAVANALPAVREVADEVTLSNQDDGVAAVIEALLA